MGPRVFQHLAVISASIPFACGAVASILFALAGFGGGHGRYDDAIGLLGFPTFWALDWVPVPAVFKHIDLLLVIWFPALVNFVVLWGPIAGLLGLMSRAATKRRMAERNITAVCGP